MLNDNDIELMLQSACSDVTTRKLKDLKTLTKTMENGLIANFDEIMLYADFSEAILPCSSQEMTADHIQQILCCFEMINKILDEVITINEKNS